MARHARRFYVEDLQRSDARITLRGDEAHHMLNVVRVRPGEEVILFDGAGTTAVARLREVRRREAELDILRREFVECEPRRSVAIACALPRSTRMDFLVEKCCELGITRLVPMVTERSVVDPIDRQQNHQRRWKHIAIEAAKQSGCARLTEIGAVLPFSAVLGLLEPGTIGLIASPEPDALPLSDCLARLAPEKTLWVLIGPEGGFTPDEVAGARERGCAVVSLGRNILRVETAAVAVAAVALLR